AYVIAHEYGHHVENLLGILSANPDRDTGPQSTAVRVELMADCLAGMWANGAAATGFIEELTAEDIRAGLDAAAAIGDDRIQQQLRGQVNPERWTHGSSAQRERWFLEGYRSGSLNACNTLEAPSV
ncbi:MAG: neutral zinc metallopeptidase, partial [Actinomycetota bacterium]